MPSSPMLWQIGVARECITPPLGCQMAGFDARNGTADAVHDDLHVRALVFDDGSTLVTLVSIEVIAVSAEFTATVRALVERATGIPAANVFLSATHTHCGPVTLNHFFNQGQPLDETYLATVASAVVRASTAAHQSRQPRTLRTGSVPVSGIAKNRRTEDGLPVDPFVGVLLVEEVNGDTAAIAVIYACHTTVLGPNTLSLTQDFPYYTLTTLQAALGPQVETVYFNGAEGDLSIGHKSDLSAIGIIDPYRTFETAQRLGETLGEAVLQNMSSLRAEPAVISVTSATLELELKRYAPLAGMTQRREQAGQAIADQAGAELVAVKQRSLFARIEEYYAMLYESSPAPEPKHLPAEMSVITLGRTALITLPGEVFVRIALGIRAASPFANTLFLGLTNDYIGYVPDEFAAASSGYEVIASRVPWQAGMAMQRAATGMLETLHAERRVAIDESIA